jgi:hypothetical protein
MKESCEHWRREIKQAFEAGKTVFVFLPPLQQFFIATGERQYSGTGRNQSVKRIVGIYDNYKCLPINITPINATGSAMKLAQAGNDILNTYWAEFGNQSEYKVQLSLDKAQPTILTKAGEKAVGALYRSRTSSGAMVLLPPLNFNHEDFFQNGSDGVEWTSEAKAFAEKLVTAILRIEKALRVSSETTPEPEWAADQKFKLRIERELTRDLLEAEQQVESAQRRKEAVLEQLQAAGNLRPLLYENGKPLEKSILEALRLLGFTATSYRDGASEFDVVFECAEGRLLGEVEGRDNKPIAIDKLRQLAMNIYEDLQREDVTMPAKGVLFGNGYRLKDPNERMEQFTEKCIVTARLSNTALVATDDLYYAVKYVSDTSDFDYSKLCREAMLSGVGIVKFPPVPSNDLEVEESVEASSS